jgi:NAD(P)-dependent dehydrogenase (short-subunit alcohol dehydrogenase family)
MSNVLITGCSAGIGLATALGLARAGHTVCATMRNLDRGKALREAAQAEQLSLLLQELDVDSDDSVAEAISAIRSRIGFIEVLVNNAGIENRGSIEETPLQVFRATMETNYFGPLRCIRACLPAMRERRSGCIVNVSSVAGKLRHHRLVRTLPQSLRSKLLAKR